MRTLAVRVHSARLHPTVPSLSVRDCSGMGRRATLAVRERLALGAAGRAGVDEDLQARGLDDEVAGARDVEGQLVLERG